MKSILLLNGNPKKENTKFDAYCEGLKTKLSENGDSVSAITLRDKTIGDCIGCYSCWLKTPGICALKDDQAEILQGFVHSDLVILASPILMGFVSADIKKVQDRLIPLVHPFLRLEVDRMAHCPRYEKTAEVGLLFEKGEYYDDDDTEIISKVYSRAAFAAFMNDNMEEVAQVVRNI